jgi:hypothetical protein
MFLVVVRFFYEFHAFRSMSQTRLFPNSRVFGVGDEEVMQRHACESEFGRERGGVMMGNMLRRAESSWLCMKLQFAFFAGHGILIRVLPPSFPALPVNELCLFFWPNPYATGFSCCWVQNCCIRFHYESSHFWAVTRFYL